MCIRVGWETMHSNGRWAYLSYPFSAALWRQPGCFEELTRWLTLLSRADTGRGAESSKFPIIHRHCLGAAKQTLQGHMLHLLIPRDGAHAVIDETHSLDGVLEYLLDPSCLTALSLRRLMKR